MRGDRQAVRARLVALYGQPRQLPPDVVDGGIGVVRVYAMSSREAAEVWAEVERTLWGNPVRAELRESVGWCVVVDVTERVAAAVEAEFEAGG